jgi:hypothetical protein
MLVDEAPVGRAVERWEMAVEDDISADAHGPELSEILKHEEVDGRAGPEDPGVTAEGPGERQPIF